MAGTSAPQLAGVSKPEQGPRVRGPNSSCSQSFHTLLGCGYHAGAQKSECRAPGKTWELGLLAKQHALLPSTLPSGAGPAFCVPLAHPRAGKPLMLAVPT